VHRSPSELAGACSGQAQNPTRGEKRKGSKCAMALWSGTVGSWTHARTCQVLDGWIDVVVLVAAVHPRRCSPTNCKCVLVQMWRPWPFWIGPSGVPLPCATVHHGPPSPPCRSLSA
jgi:hypothetical protein